MMSRLRFVGGLELPGDELKLDLTKCREQPPWGSQTMDLVTSPVGMVSSSRRDYPNPIRKCRVVLEFGLLMKLSANSCHEVRVISWIT